MVKKDPISGRTPTLTLTATVQPRNIGLKSNPKDTTPPGPPQAVRSWNPAVCSAPNLCPDPTLGCAKLELRWTANTEADLAGYKILYGFDSSGYSNSVQLFRGPKTSGDKYYTMTGLAATKFAAWAGAHFVYKIQVQAFDKNQNYSALSSPVTFGDKVSTASIRLESDLGATLTNNDSVVDVDPAAAPATFGAAPPAGWDADPPTTASMATWNKIVLTWSASATPGVIGYRIYRGDSASFVPSDTPGPTFNRIANENNARCQRSDLHRHRPHRLRHLPLQDRSDQLRPDLPDHRHHLAALRRRQRAGQGPAGAAGPENRRRLGLPQDHPHPHEPGDFRHGFRTRFRPLGGLLEQGPGELPGVRHGHRPGRAAPVDPEIQLGATLGTWVGEGTLPTINFNDHTSASATGFNLDPDTTYYFLAVSYDKCGNHSTVTSSSVAEGTQCGDCLQAAPAPPDTHDPVCWGAPAAMDINNLKVEGCYDYIKLNWDAVDDTAIRDFQGFRVYRREGASFFGGNPPPRSA